jgi:glycosyltransferase involved in cell wall biosynthesis
MKKMPGICFVEPQAYSVLNSDTRLASTGGESVQHMLLAREFAKRGWRVSMVSKDVGQRDGVVIDGVQVWKTYRQTAGLPFVRFLHPRLTSMWRAVRNADADVYFQSCAGLMTGVVARFVDSRSRRMIFRVAHDSDCIPDQQLIRIERDRRIYEYGLRKADLISVQSNTQAELLTNNYGLSSVEVNMVAEIPGLSTDSDRDIDVLWVNNFRAFKRPELVLQIAKNMPDVSFAMIGGSMKGHDDLFREVENEAATIDNIRFIGAVPYSEVNSYFSRAKLFLNTSDSEGFPNSFLQAWVRGVPVVSFFDPDGLIDSEELGISVDNQSGFEEALAALLRSDEARSRIGQHARQFVIDRYSSQAIVDQYERLIGERLFIGLH